MILFGFAYFDLQMWTETTSEHGRESLNRRCDESADSVSKARDAAAVEHVFPPGGEVGSPSGGVGKAPPHRCGGEDRRAPSQILPRAPLSAARPPPASPRPHPRHGGPENPANAARPRLLRRRTRQAHGHGRGSQPGRGARVALRSGKLQQGSREGAARIGGLGRQLPRRPRRENAPARGRRDGIAGDGGGAAGPPR